MAVNVPQRIGSQSDNIELIFYVTFIWNVSLMATALYNFACVEKTKWLFIISRPPLENSYLFTH